MAFFDSYYHVDIIKLTVFFHAGVGVGVRDGGGSGDDAATAAANGIGGGGGDGDGAAGPAPLGYDGHNESAPDGAREREYLHIT